MRTGKNPAKELRTVTLQERVTVALLTYVPFVSGYWAQALEIIQHSVTSARNHAGVPHNLLVFDNGSCREATDFLRQLQDSNLIDHLVLSRDNIGKVGAWNFIFGAGPGEVIAYADSDVLFLPGWLSKHLEILDAYPNVGMVSGVAINDWPPQSHLKKTFAALRESENVTFTGRLAPEQWSEHHYRSLGTDYANADRSESPITHEVVFNGVPAFVGARHFQFVLRKDVVAPLLPLQATRPINQETTALDARLADEGYYLLSTTERCVLHLGNRLTPDVRDLIGDQQVTVPASKSPLTGSRILDTRAVKKVLLGIHNRIFRWYYDRPADHDRA